jgi:hypothetical protein
VTGQASCLLRLEDDLVCGSEVLGPRIATGVGGKARIGDLLKRAAMRRTFAVYGLF